MKIVKQSWIIYYIDSHCGMVGVFFEHSISWWHNALGRMIKDKMILYSTSL